MWKQTIIENTEKSNSDESPLFKGMNRILSEVSHAKGGRVIHSNKKMKILMRMNEPHKSMSDDQLYVCERKELLQKG